MICNQNSEDESSLVKGRCFSSFLWVYYDKDRAKGTLRCILNFEETDLATETKASKGKLRP